MLTMQQLEQSLGDGNLCTRDFAETDTDESDGESVQWSTPISTEIHEDDSNYEGGKLPQRIIIDGDGASKANICIVEIALRT